MLRPSAVVELVWQDASGSTAATTVWANSSLTVEQIAANAETLAAIVASLTGAVLVRERIQYRSAIGATSPASGAASIKRTGIFFFSTGDDTPLALVSVPAIKDSLLETSGPREGIGIILTDSDVDTFANAVIDSDITNPFADDIIGLPDAYLQSRV